MTEPRPSGFSLLIVSAISGTLGSFGTGFGFAFSSLKRFSTSWLRQRLEARFLADSFGVSSKSLGIAKFIRFHCLQNSTIAALRLDLFHKSDNLLTFLYSTTTLHYVLYFGRNLC